MEDPPDCVKCGQGHYAHIVIVDKDGEWRNFCPNVYTAPEPPIDKRTRRERLKEDGHY